MKSKHLSLSQSKQINESKYGESATIKPIKYDRRVTCKIHSRIFIGKSKCVDCQPSFTRSDLTGVEGMFKAIKARYTNPGTLHVLGVEGYRERMLTILCKGFGVEAVQTEILDSLEQLLTEAREEGYLTGAREAEEKQKEENRISQEKLLMGFGYKAKGESK